MNLQLMCPIGYTGYGYASINLIKALNSQNHNMCLFPIGQPSVEDESDASLIKHLINNFQSISYDSTCIKIWHQFDLLNRPGNGEYFAFPFFEVDTLQTNEIYHLNFPDSIIVSSKWAKSVLEKNNITKPIHIVPLGVNLDIFDSSKMNNTSKNNYVFCTIGKWEKRKAHDSIIECFNKAFDEKDNVELWLVTHNGFLNKDEEKQWLDLVVGSKLKKKIKIFPRLAKHKDVAEVIHHSDCGIYISRGEGWNMELLETIAMNKPVIASYYSAHTEYCTPQNSYLVDMNDTEPAIDNKWFFGQSNWGKIGPKQIDQTIEYMRFLYHNDIRTNPSGLETAKKYSWDYSAKSLISVLNR